MTLKECFNMWIAQYNEFKERFEKAVEVNPDFNSVVDSMSSKYTKYNYCLLYTSPSPRDRQKSRMPSSA